MEWKSDRTTWMIVLLDALLGVVIGSVSMATLSARQPNRVFDPGRYVDIATLSVFMFGAVFFLATLLLAPFLVRYLRGRLHVGRRSYYRDSVVAGIAFGIGASAAVGLFFPLSMALVPGVPDYTFQDRITLALLGPLLMVPGTLLTALMLFGLELIGFGIAFGLLNGWLVRRARFSAPL
jgi:hypothetical protein